MSEIINSHLLGKVTVLVMVVLCVNTAAALDGSGTEQDPWLIQSLDDFNDFAADANYWAGFTRLETDVNLAGRIYTTAVIAPYPTVFTGVFDGNDHKILNLTIDGGGAGNNYLGLFGRIDGGKVGKLALEGGSVRGDWYVGVLVGKNDGNISDCYSTGSVSGYNGVGRLVGLNDGLVSNCYSTGFVSGCWAVGGLVGLAGSSGGSVSYCYSTGDASGEVCVGGLVGHIWEGTVSKCYATCDVNSVGYAGGLVGCNDYGSVSNCYSIGDVSGRDGNVGGLLGYNREGTVSNCYAAGDVNGVGYVGGLIGYNYAEIGFSFWDTDTQTHGVTDSIGDNQGTAINVAGLPTAEMQAESTFTNASWDFINVWNIGENQTYPYLRVYLAADLNKDGIVNFLDIAITANQWLEDAPIE